MNHPTAMRHTLAIIAALLCTTLLHAQSPFIEVNITDTLVLEPTSIVYRVSSGSSSTFMGMRMPYDDTESAAPQQDLNTVLLLLKKNKFNVEEEAPTDYTIGNTGMGTKAGKPAASLLVTVHSEAELRRCVELLSGLEGISGSVATVRHASMESQLPAFHKAVLAQARTEAQAIAKASDLELGRVISVQERPSGGTDNYMDMMRDMMKRGVEAFNPSEAIRKLVVKTMVVRFEAR